MASRIRHNGNHKKSTLPADVQAQVFRGNAVKLLKLDADETEN